MGYDKHHIPILSAKEGYNKLANSYRDHHAFLTQRDKGLSQRFFPRSLDGLRLLDLGGGDGRTARLLERYNFAQYLLVDIAEKMLEHAPHRTQQQQVDLEGSWGIVGEFDLILSYFVLIHVHNLQNFFDQAYQCLDSSGRFIVLHHIERKPYLHKVHGESFRIQLFHHSYEEIELTATRSGFCIDYLDLSEHGIPQSRAYCFTLGG